ncbi:LysR family transcriptional regulator [Actinomadura gamaensis]|uniref:LysR family transcriptional regulator n=1 Tax=Actinomadura gamaensis TaxID=1763541 RepID=A0ABV9TXK6_9ACTN
MELRQLRYFVAVAEEAGFTRAAERLHVAQPGISAQVRQLEREFGQELFDRSGRSVKLTEAGEAVLPYARAALWAADGARLAVDELSGLVRGRVAVGTVTSMPSDLVPDLLAGLHRDHPGVEITLVEGASADLLRDLLEGRLDLAFVGLAGDPPHGIAVQTYVDERLVVVVAEDDELAGRTRVALPELRDRRLMSLPRGTGIRAIVEAGCVAAGFEPTIAFEAADPLVLLQLVTRGLGVAVVPASLARAHPDLVRMIEIDGPELRGRVALAWRSEGPMSPAARELVRRARAAL